VRRRQAGRFAVVAILGWLGGCVLACGGPGDGGDWQALEAAGGPVWEGTFAVPTAPGQHALEVRASGPDGTASHAIAFVAQ